MMENTKTDQIANYTKTSSPIPSFWNHQLWVNLSALGQGNVFSTVLPSLLKHYLIDGTEGMDGESFDIILPSDVTWQTKIYYKLVEKQRMIDSGSSEMLTEEEPKATKLHEWNILPKNAPSPACTPEPRLPEKQKKKTYLAPITWTVSDLSKAGCLLAAPPLSATFDDEQEMRRVYSLIYDVFRYKNIMMQALNDVTFFQIYPKLKESIHHVWLLLFDLYHRSFKKRETSVAPLANKLFDAVGLSYAENALWTQRVRLAAAVARLRIKHNALSLDELLPPHLKDEKVIEQAKHSPVTCWVNCIKVTDIKELTESIEKTFKLKMVTDIDKLDKNTFKWDRHCPQIMAFHSSMRANLAKSHFVKSHLLIVQDKSFCRGAATFGKILIDLGLTGSVIQTHVNSPRTTAYLATLLTHNEKIKKLMAFSAGKRKPEYEHYFTELGVTNIKIFSDRLIDLSPDASYMEEVVAVFATPPNSYSAVTDPIDLVCSRGGDLSMLEILTESEETKEAKERVISILEEQRKTLRFAMSRPQIQFVLYETHSELDAENEDMVIRTVKDVNRMAKLQHATLLGKTPIPDSPMDEDTPEAKVGEKPHVTEGGDEIELAKRSSLDSTSSKLIIDSKEKFLDNLQVPDTDLFTTPELPSLCPNETSCINFRREGCYLSLIQRKEVIRLDDKYMIQMAENRGLFGSTTTQNTMKSKGSKASRKKQDKAERKSKSRKKLKETEIERIAAPTHTFLSHVKHEAQLCHRCQFEQDNVRLPTSQYKKWWTECTRHIIDLKKYLIRHKLLPSQRLKQITQKQIVGSLVASTDNNANKVDEIAAECNISSRIPIFPKLRLTRENKFAKIQMKDKYSQTSDESEDESEGLSDDSSKEEDELISPMAPSDLNSYRPSTRNILGRLTSAHIRQFVSPDFKQDFSSFYVPSLAINTKSRPNSETSSRKLRESIRSKLDVKLLRKMAEKSPKSSTEKTLERKPTKEKRKAKKKSLLERLRSPTLSFILKTQRLPGESSGQASYVLRNVSSPCERFNRRHPGM